MEDNGRFYNVKFKCIICEKKNSDKQGSSCEEQEMISFSLSCVTASYCLRIKGWSMIS